MNIPADNPMTPKKIALGERLFFEKGLSADHTVSCGSCHHPSAFFAGEAALSKGVRDQAGQRNAPSILNTGYLQHLMWDGRSVSLEDQAGYPLMHPREMGNTRAAATQFLAADPQYRSAFKEAFATDKITWDQVAKALASFERTLVSGDAPFDRYMSGNASAISPSAIRGFELFRGPAGCITCHTYDKDNPFFTDSAFHNTGVGWDGSPDLGRYEISKEREDKGAFRTPSLRNVAKTAPYMHNGQLKTISEVLDFYSHGCGKNPFLDTRLHALNFTAQQKEDLLAFLNSLTGDVRYKPAAFVDENSRATKGANDPRRHEFGHVEVIAGSSNFGDNGPAMDAVFVGIGGLAVSASGDLYVSDTGGNRVRKIDHKTGIITTVAGTGLLQAEGESRQAAAQALRGPGPLALSPDGRALYIGEIVGRKVQRLDLGSGEMQDIGAPQGGFGKPDGLAWTPSGLLVADPPRGQVWKFSPDRTWSAMWPKEARPVGAIRTVAADSRGAVYTAEYFAHRVLKWDPAARAMQVIAGTGEEGKVADGAQASNSPLHTPDGILVDPLGDLLIADKGNHRIVRVDHTNGRLTTVAEAGAQGTEQRWTPGPIALDASGQIWIGDIYQNLVLRLPPGSKAPVVVAGKGNIGDGGSALEARFAHPGGVTSDKLGNVYVSDTLHHRVRVIDAKSGRIQTVAGTGIPGFNGDGFAARTAWLGYPAKLQVDEGGRLYIGDYYNNRVRRVDLRTGLISTIAGNGTAGELGDGGKATDAALLNPHALLLQSGALVIASAVSSRLRWVDLDHGRIHAVPVRSELPESLEFYGIASWNGGLVLASPRPGSIQVIKDGQVSTLLDRKEIVFPEDVAVSPEGELYICETGRNRIVRWNGSSLDVVADNLGRPRSMSFDADGNLLVADTFHNRILRITTATEHLKVQLQRCVDRKNCSTPRGHA